MFKKYMSPSDPSGGSVGSPDDGASATQPDQGNQQEWKKLYETLKSKYDVDLAKAEERRQGLQSIYTKEQEAHKTAKQETEELKKLMSAVSAEKDSIATNLSALEKTAMEKEIEIETLRRKDKRAKLIFGKFPELAPFEADGLLPEAEEEKLEDVFGNFLNKLGTVKEKSKQDYGKGGTESPPAPKDKEPEGLAALRLKMQEAALTGNTKEYDKTFEQYLNLKDSK